MNMTVYKVGCGGAAPDAMLLATAVHKLLIARCWFSVLLGIAVREGMMKMVPLEELAAQRCQRHHHP